MRKKKRLGEMLVENGLLTEAQIQQAIRDKAGKNMKLGQFLVRQGIVQEKELVDVISSQLNVGKYDARRYPLDLSLAEIIPREMAGKYQAVPLMKRGMLLTVAMTDPSDIYALDGIESAAKSEVEAIICTEQELIQLTSAIYGSHADIHGVMEDMDIDNEVETDADNKPGNVEIGSLQNMAEEVPVIRLVNSILSRAVKDKASDIHISPEKKSIRIRFRIDGKMVEVPAPPKNMFLPIVSRLKIVGNLDIAVSRIPQDGRFTIKMDQKEVNVRISTLPTIHGENVVMRLLDTSGGILSLDRLGFSKSEQENIGKLIHQPYGMILAAGPTGSGKSTTLYSILQQLNNKDINIITLEDPVEYQMQSVCQVQLNTKAGMTFSSGLRSILRQDPDVIMVGEIRDSETATIGVQAALTGHRVLSTVHTNDAAGAITRFVDMGIEPFLVSSVMLLTIAQRLLRKVCPHCKEPYTPNEALLKFWGLDKAQGGDFVRGKGCFQCMNTGYQGRVGIYEVLVIDDVIRKMIMEEKSAMEITEVAILKNGMKSLKESAADKILNGLTTFEEATATVMM